MAQINWEYIIDTIKSEKCILMLGPEIPLTNQGQPLHEALESYLGVATDSNIIYFNDDEFFLFKDETAKFPTYLNIQKFYTNTTPGPIYDKLARIPFHLILSLSPDLLLKQVYEKKGLSFDFDYYKKYENPQAVKAPTSENPLIYNLFGCVEDDESLIFTHDDMFEFLFAISSTYQLPDEIKNEMRTAKNFILLGFKFDKWYVKLILRLFNLHTGRFLRYASEGREVLESDTREWYENLFKINFVEHQVDNFVSELYDHCEQAGIIKAEGERQEAMAFTDRVKAYIKEDDLDTAIEALDTYLTGAGEEDLVNDLTLVSSSYRRVKRRMKSNTLNASDAEVKVNQVVSSLLDIVDEIKEIEAAGTVG